MAGKNDGAPILPDGYSDPDITQISPEEAAAIRADNIKNVRSFLDAAQRGLTGTQNYKTTENSLYGDIVGTTRAAAAAAGTGIKAFLPDETVKVAITSYLKLSKKDRQNLRSGQVDLNRELADALDLVDALDAKDQEGFIAAKTALNKRFSNLGDHFSNALEAVYTNGAAAVVGVGSVAVGVGAVVVGTGAAVVGTGAAVGAGALAGVAIVGNRAVEAIATGIASQAESAALLYQANADVQRGKVSAAIKEGDVARDAAGKLSGVGSLLNSAIAVANNIGSHIDQSYANESQAEYENAVKVAADNRQIAKTADANVNAITDGADQIAKDAVNAVKGVFGMISGAFDTSGISAQPNNGGVKKDPLTKAIGD